MTESGAISRPLIGTYSYDNWLAHRNGVPPRMSVEHLIYSDARLTDTAEDGLGPYQFFNMISPEKPFGVVGAVITLRYSLHIDFDAPPMEKTDTKSYHGGSMAEELAALASLKCGVRYRAGGESRLFGFDKDPRGRPYSFNSYPEPTMNVSVRGIVLQNAAGESPMTPIKDLATFSTLTPGQAIAVVKSARLYQDALWLTESEPNLSWLMLVSAVETAANEWHAAGDSALVRLEAEKPELVEYLQGIGRKGLAERVANEFVDSIGATRKFVEFLINHLPPPPDIRPAEAFQVEWTSGNLKRAFKEIYNCRSKSLHEGKPFPLLMCEAPMRINANETVERPTCIAASAHGGTWLAKDMPMHLHIFEYIARNAINSWWKSMASPLGEAEAGDEGLVS